MRKTIELLASRIASGLDAIPNEATTIQALIHPFIRALGYDVTDPADFVAEFRSDFSDKGDCADGAIFYGGKPIIILEFKDCRRPLSKSFENQLKKYFNVHPSARVGILTNGIEYRFFTDSVERNIMDDEPFLAFSVSKPQTVPYDALLLFSKSHYTSGLFERIRAICRITREMLREMNGRAGALAVRIFLSVLLKDQPTAEDNSAIVSEPMPQYALRIVRHELAGIVPEEQLEIHSTTDFWCSIAIHGKGNLVEVQFNEHSGKKWIRMNVLDTVRHPIGAVSDLSSFRSKLIEAAEILLKKY